MNAWNIFKDFFLNLLFPSFCVSCRKEGDFLCDCCLDRLNRRKIHPFSAGWHKRPAEFCYLDGVIYALDYAKNPQIRAAVRQFKYRFTEDLAGIFGSLIARKIGELQMTQGRRIVLVPIPLHQSRMNERGFNQAELVAQSVFKFLPVSVSAEIQPLLIRAQSTGQQAKLGREARLENLKEVFELNKKFVHPSTSLEITHCKPQTLYFLVDDVCTTGATLENAAKILKENGVRKVYGLTLARSFRKFPVKQS